MHLQKIILQEERNVSLDVYLQSAEGMLCPRRPGMVILPGGAYATHVFTDVDPAAFVWLKAGFQVFVLHYSTGRHAQWPNPLKDYEDAMDIIRSRNEEWNVDPDKIAVAGFSAGGHLAGCAATMSRQKPNAAILGYAPLEESTVRFVLPSAPDVVSAVDDTTCPCFLFHTRNDNRVPVRNSVNFMAALTEHGISYESHIYAFGPHGISVCESSILHPDASVCSRAPRWTEDSIEWLRDIFGTCRRGVLTSPPVLSARVDGNRDKYLSVDCTIGYLLDKQEARTVLTPVLDRLNAALPAYYSSTLRSMAPYLALSEEFILKTDTMLCQIKNLL